MYSLYFFLLSLFSLSLSCPLSLSRPLFVCLCLSINFKDIMDMRGFVLLKHVQTYRDIHKSHSNIITVYLYLCLLLSVISLSVCLSISVCLSVSISLALCLSFCLPLPAYCFLICLFLYLSLSLCFSLTHCLHLFLHKRLKVSP